MPYKPADIALLGNYFWLMLLAWFLSKHHHQVEWKLWMIALKARNAKREREREEMCFAKMTTIPERAPHG